MTMTMGTEGLLRELGSPGKDTSQVPFWFWNGGLDPAEMRRQVAEAAAKGVHGMMPHPRFGMDRRDYLEEPFWRAMDATIEQAKELGATIHLYDEYNWPSGGAGGRVTDGRPDLYPRGLDYLEQDVDGPCSLELDKFEPGEPSCQEFEAVVAGFLVGPGSAPAAWGTVSPERDSIAGDVPAGAHRVVVFFQNVAHNPSPLDTGSGSFVDYLNPETAARFIELTHEEYRRRYASDFGTTIKSVFCDEPAVLSAGPFPWTEAFAGAFASRRGYDLMPHLLALVEDSYPDGYRHRGAYYETLGELFRDNFLTPVSRWCEENSLALCGHLFEENIAAWPNAIQLMESLRAFHWPGMDALGPHGSAAGAKIPASVAHLSSKEHFVCESLGLAEGWNATLGMARRAYHFLAAMGVDTFIPHAFFQSTDSPRVECPPSFFEQNPYWKYYEAVANLTARLSVFNRAGTHVAPVAVYYPIESLWCDGTGGRGRGSRPWQSKQVGNSRGQRTIETFNRVVEALSASPYDCDVVDSHALAGATVSEGFLRVGPEAFSCVVVPGARTISPAVLAKLGEFAASGGFVLFVQCLPARLYPSGDLPQWFVALQGALDNTAAGEDVHRAHGRGLTAFAAAADPNPLAGVYAHAEANYRVVGGEAHGLLGVSRNLGDGRSWLFANDSTAALSATIELHCSREAKGLVLVDTSSGVARHTDISRLPDPDCLAFALALQPSEAVIVVESVQSGSPARGSDTGDMVHTETELTLGPWTIQVVPEMLESQWLPWVGSQEVELPRWRMEPRGWRSMKGWEQPDFDDTAWQAVTAVRGGALSEAESVLLRTTLPPGASSVALPLPVTGEYMLWANGTLVEKRMGPPGGGALDISALVVGVGDVLAIETASESTLSGLSGPVRVLCGPVPVTRLSPWADWGLDWYCGRVAMACTFEVPVAHAGTRAVLDLGDVHHYAEVWVNGKLATALLWSPYRADVSALLTAGTNTLSIIASNSAAARFAWDKWGTRCGASWGVGPKPEPWGVLGPVRLTLA